MSYEQLAASVDALVNANIALTDTVLDTQTQSSANVAISADNAAMALAAAEEIKDMSRPVTKFGADPTGVADSYNSFLSAGDGAFIPFGTYRLSQDLPGTFISSPGTTLTGPGYAFALESNDKAFTGKVVTITVGATGKFQTLSKALEFAHRKYSPSYVHNAQTRVDVKLLAGFVLNEQIAIDSVQMNFIRIISESATVDVDSSTFTRQDTESRYPLFHCLNGGKSPIIGVLFNIPVAATYAIRVAGFSCDRGGDIQLLPGSGIINAERGCSAYGGRIHCYIPGLTTQPEGAGTSVSGVVLSPCRGRAIFAAHDGQINLPRSQIQNCTGDVAVYALWGARINIYQSDISGSKGEVAVHSRDGSIVCARETCVSGATGNGYHALHVGYIDARYHANIWSKTGAINCGGYAVLASYGSTIDCSELPCTGNTGSAAVHASMTSTITADLVNASNSSRGFYSIGGSKIYVGNSTANNCSIAGYRVDTGGKISGQYATSNGSQVGFLSESGGELVVPNATAIGCVSRAVLAQAQGNINARMGVFTGALDTAVRCLDGSYINIDGSDCSGYTGFGVTCREGSEVYARNVNARKTVGVDGAGDFHVSGKGTEIYAVGGTGGTSVTVNTWSADGVIYK